MAFKVKPRFRPKLKRKIHAKRKFPTNKRLANRIKSLSRRVRPEVKFKLDNQVSGAMTVAGTLTFMNGLAQGVDEGNRIGDQVMSKSIMLRYLLINTSTAVQVARIMAVLWLDDSVPVTADVITSTGSGIYMSPYNYNNKGTKFKLLYDKVHVFGTDSGATNITDNSIAHVEKLLKINHRVQYKGANVADAIYGKVYIFQCASANTVTSELAWSYHYTDA